MAGGRGGGKGGVRDGGRGGRSRSFLSPWVTYDLPSRFTCPQELARNTVKGYSTLLRKNFLKIYLSAFAKYVKWNCAPSWNETMCIHRICRMKLCTLTEYMKLCKSLNLIALWKFMECVELNRAHLPNTWNESHKFVTTVKQNCAYSQNTRKYLKYEYLSE